jgi:GTP-binding protein HflX
MLLVKAKPAYTADQLFATLDTTTRQFTWGSRAFASFSTPLAFIRDLPHGLIDALLPPPRSVDADLLLHG